MLAAQNTRDEAGLVVNLAQVNDGLFIQPDFAWVREYRRAYAAATNKMTSDGSFVQGMNRVAIRLWPRAPQAYPSSVLQNILDLGRHQVVIFEEWVTRRAIVPTLGASAPDLAGSDLRAYEDALIHFVTSWEALESEIISSYDLRKSAQIDNETYWSACASSCLCFGRTCGTSHISLRQRSGTRT